MDFKWKWSALYINLYIKIALHLKTKKGQWFWLFKKKRKTVNNMQNAVCLNLYCVFLMRSRPDWIRNIVHYSFFPLSLFLSLILPQRVLLLDESDFCGAFFTLWRMFVKHELVVKDHETMHKCLGGGGGRWGFYGLLLSGWSIAGVFGIQCVGFFLVFSFF